MATDLPVCVLQVEIWRAAAKLATTPKNIKRLKKAGLCDMVVSSLDKNPEPELQQAIWEAVSNLPFKDNAEVCERVLPALEQAEGSVELEAAI